MFYYANHEQLAEKEDFVVLHLLPECAGGGTVCT